MMAKVPYSSCEVRRRGRGEEKEEKEGNERERSKERTFPLFSNSYLMQQRHFLLGKNSKESMRFY
jgi:hypothetical protein